MSAPVATVRQTPAGIKLDDGFSSKITFAADPDVSLWEKTVKPPGLDGGDPVETTTMHNTNVRTFGPRQLKTMTESTFTAAYDPACYTQLLALINVPTTVTVLFPDGSTLAFFGYLRTFDPSELEEGTQPEATCNLQPTNYDPVGKTEEDPVLTSAVGT